MGGLLLAGSGCSPEQAENISRGSDLGYKEGFPELRIDAVGLIDQQDQTVIRTTGQIVYGSLIFSKKGQHQQATVVIEIRLYADDKKNDLRHTKRFEINVQDSKTSVVTSQDVLTFERILDAEPGKYTVEVTATDASSNKGITRSKKVTVPDPTSTDQFLTSIQLLGKQKSTSSGRYYAITTYDIPALLDSLKFQFQVSNFSSNNLRMESRLMKFRSDTTPARSMSNSGYSPSSLSYKGIEYDKRTLLQSTERTLSQTGAVTIEFTFPMLDRGNYRFEVVTFDSAGNEQLFKARDFGIKSENYPTLKTPGELARPLYYLMREKEYREMMQIQNPKALKEAIDRFWLTNIEDKDVARRVIRKYYQRVEQANKRFSNFKEGWKTDRGMIYILFGLPYYTEQHVGVLEWSYTYNQTDSRYHFVFRAPRQPSAHFPFHHYIFQRSNGYFDVEYQQRQRWLSGYILQQGR